MIESSSGKRRWLEGADGPGRAILVLVVVLLAALTGYLIAGPNPWFDGVFEKLDGGGELDEHDHVVAGAWFGAALNAVICLLLLASAGWWASPPESRRGGRGSGGGSHLAMGMSLASSSTLGSPRAVPQSGASAGVCFWLLLLAAMVLAAWLRYPRLDHGFTAEEAQAFREYTWGRYLEKTPNVGEEGPAALAFEVERVGWERSLFHNESGDNHVMHSATARLADRVWRRAVDGGVDETTFRESVVRAIPFGAGILCIALTGLWLKSSGFPLGGVTAALLLALSPWHARHGVEARGYSEWLLWLLLALLALAAGLRAGRWRSWLAYGFCLALVPLCLAGALYLVVVLSGVVGIVLLARRDGGSLRRWLVATALGAMLTVQVLAPTAAGLWQWLKTPQPGAGSLNREWWLNLWSEVSAGMPWAINGAGSHHGVAVGDLGVAGLWIYGAVLPLLLIIGLLLVLFRAPSVAIFVVAMAGAVGLSVWHQILGGPMVRARDHFPLVIVLVIGLGLVVECFRRRRSGTESAAESPGRGRDGLDCGGDDRRSIRLRDLGAAGARAESRALAGAPGGGDRVGRSASDWRRNRSGADCGHRSRT